MMDALHLLFGLSIWWLYFGVECFLNGSMRGGLLMPFIEWWNELLWNLPVCGWRFRMRFTGGDQWQAARLPGRWHFLAVNVLMPLSPWLAWRAFKSG